MEVQSSRPFDANFDPVEYGFNLAVENVKEVAQSWIDKNKIIELIEGMKDDPPRDFQDGVKKLAVEFTKEVITAIEKDALADGLVGFEAPPELAESLADVIVDVVTIVAAEPWGTYQVAGDKMIDFGKEVWQALVTGHDKIKASVDSLFATKETRKEGIEHTLDDWINGDQAGDVKDLIGLNGSFDSVNDLAPDRWGTAGGDQIGTGGAYDEGDPIGTVSGNEGGRGGSGTGNQPIAQPGSTGSGTQPTSSGDDPNHVGSDIPSSQSGANGSDSSGSSGSTGNPGDTGSTGGTVEPGSTGATSGTTSNNSGGSTNNPVGWPLIEYGKSYGKDGMGDVDHTNSTTTRTVLNHDGTYTVESKNPDGSWTVQESGHWREAPSDKDEKTKSDDDAEENTTNEDEKDGDSKDDSAGDGDNTTNGGSDDPEINGDDTDEDNDDSTGDGDSGYTPSEDVGDGRGSYDGEITLDPALVGACGPVKITIGDNFEAFLFAEESAELLNDMVSNPSPEEDDASAGNGGTVDPLIVENDLICPLDGDGTGGLGTPSGDDFYIV